MADKKSANTRSELTKLEPIKFKEEFFYLDAQTHVPMIWKIFRPK